MDKDYDDRVKATAATRLAYILRDAKILNDFGLAEFLYPSMEAIQQAEGEKL